MWTGGHIIVEGRSQEATRRLIVRVPHNSSLDVSTSNGAIHVSGVAGRMWLVTSNGAIKVENTGGSEIHASTSNGKIDVELARGIHANISARTSNGRVYSEIPLAVSRLEDTILEGKAGKGGASIDLQTSNGAIYIRFQGGGESVRSTFTPEIVK